MSHSDRCVFCQIASGAARAAVVLDDGVSVALLDRRPVFKGHALLVPREHYETLSGLPPDLVSPLFLNARRLSSAVQRAMGADGTFVAINNVVSQSVPHLHVHVVPRRRGDGLRGFFWPRTRYESDAEMEEVAEAIRTALRSED